MMYMIRYSQYAVYSIDRTHRAGVRLGDTSPCIACRGVWAGILFRPRGRLGKGKGQWRFGSCKPTKVSRKRLSKRRGIRTVGKLEFDRKREIGVFTHTGNRGKKQNIRPMTEPLWLVAERFCSLLQVGQKRINAAKMARNRHRDGLKQVKANLSGPIPPVYMAILCLK